MFVGITNTPRPYAWGSRTAIAELLGTQASGEPEAELWLGALSGSPSLTADPAETGGATAPAAWVAADPVTTLGPFASTGRLPFLLKLLAAGAPLSLQAHPTAEQAREGFRRENESGVPLDAPYRNYRDEDPKPELIYALSETFDALCGFRPLASFREIVDELWRLSSLADSAAIDDLMDRAASDDALPGIVEWLSTGGQDVDALVSQVSALAGSVLVGPASAGSAFEPEFATVRLLAEQYPGDPGIVISLLLNRVT